MGQIISVVSGKGGVGKSTVTTGLGRCLTALGVRTLVVDTDCGLCAAEFLLENGGSGVYTLGDVLQGDIQPDMAIVPGLSFGLPDFLPAPEQTDGLGDGVAAARCIQQLAQQYDCVLLDRSAGFDCSLERQLHDYSGLVVCQSEGMSLRGAGMMATRLQQAGCGSVHLVLNRFRPARMRDKTLPDVDNVCDRVGATLLGIVPEDKAVLTDQAKGEFTPKAPYAKALSRIALRITGQSVPLPKLRKIMK